MTMLEWTFEVERDGDDAYVIERQEGVSGMIKHGPMPRDFAGPFIDERREYLMDAAQRLVKQMAWWKSPLAVHQHVAIPYTLRPLNRKGSA